MFTAAKEIEKRIVLLHPSGLHQILGVSPANGQPPALLGDNPAHGQIFVAGQPTIVNLVQAKHRYYVYKPVMAPRTTKSFNPAQR